MRMDTHRPPEPRSSASCEKVDPVFHIERCAHQEEEHRPDPKSGHHFWGRGSRRLLWFVAIYAASLAGFAALVYGLRGLIPH
jgi:hypothetical protein